MRNLDDLSSSSAVAGSTDGGGGGSSTTTRVDAMSWDSFFPDTVGGNGNSSNSSMSSERPNDTVVEKSPIPEMDFMS